MDASSGKWSLSLGDRVVDLALGVVRGPGSLTCALNEREVALLRLLADSGGAMVSRGALLAGIWGYSESSVSRAVDVTIGRLRKKLEADPRRPRFLLTCYADGYRLLGAPPAGPASVSLPEAYARQLARHVGTTLQREDCVVYGVRDRSLVQIAAFGPKACPEFGVIDPLVIPIGQGIVGHVAEHRTLERITDTRRDARYIRDSFSGLSEVAVPIVTAGGALVGVLDTEDKRRDTFSDRVVEAMVSLGAMAGAAAR